MYIGADFHSAIVATAPGEKKTPHRAPPYEELDPATLTINDTDGNAVRYQAYLLCRKLHLFLGKSTKTAATRAALFDSNICTKSFDGWGFAPDPTGRAYRAPAAPLAVFREAYF